MRNFANATHYANNMDETGSRGFRQNLSILVADKRKYAIILCNSFLDKAETLLKFPNIGSNA